MIMGFYKKHVKETPLRLVPPPPHFNDDDNIDMPALLQQTDSDSDSDSDSEDERPLVVRRSGGHLKGSTDKKRRIGEVAIVATVNEIAS